MENQQALTDKIAKFRGGVLCNPYQSSDKKVLFVCSIGILRSATAARIYARKYNTRCAGTFKEALIPITQLLIDWADLIVWVNQENYRAASFLFDEQEFSYKSKILNIKDTYCHMQPGLIRKFKKQFETLRTAPTPILRKQVIVK